MSEITILTSHGIFTFPSPRELKKRIKELKEEGNLELWKEFKIATIEHHKTLQLRRVQRQFKECQGNPRRRIRNTIKLQDRAAMTEEVITHKRKSVKKDDNSP